MPNPQIELQRAHAALSGGQPTTAARVCQKLLTNNPRNSDARYLHGRSLAALGRWREAATEFRRVLSDRNGLFAAMVDLGIAETFDGNYREAREILERARAIDSRPPELHFGLGLCSLGFGDYQGAVMDFRSAIERNPRFPDAYNNLGVAYDRLGEVAEAAGCFRRAVAIHAGHADAHRNLGDALSRLGDAAGAIAAFQHAADCRPADASAHADLGAAQLAVGEQTAAATSLKRALELDPNCAAALAALARIASPGDHATPTTGAGSAVADSMPRDTEATLLAASRLEALGQSADALSMLRAEANTRPGNADIQDTLGALLHRLGRLPEALDCYERALDIDEYRAHTLVNCGRALESMGALGRALTCFERALALRPSEAAIVASIVSWAYRVCDWERARTLLSTLSRLPNGIDALPTFLMLATDLNQSDIAQSLQRRAHANPRPCATHTPAIRPAAPRADLRVAYVSPDFRAHPVAYAIAGMIENHDRTRVSPIAISLKPGDGSAIEERLKGAFDEFIDASALSDQDIVKLVRERAIDVAVDLAGLTTGARTGIFALRAAPTQVNYLGYPGSTGEGFMDFIIGDRIVLPQSDEIHYREKILRMPHSYLPFDDTRDIPAAAGREAAGLPPDGFVFCAFNNSYKITRAMFEVWMSLLRDVPGSVLWLRSMGAEAAANLKDAAVKLDVSAKRLVFASFEAEIGAHLGRLTLADLFLDTLPYNAHTTAAEALWAGVPVITCLGTAFAGRVGASLMSASGLEELICPDIEAYGLLALELARSPSRLLALRERLQHGKGSAPLFDTRAYTRDFEDLLYLAHQGRAAAPG